MFFKFPYVDMYTLNLDWMIKYLEETKASLEEWQTIIDSLGTIVHSVNGQTGNVNLGTLVNSVNGKTGDVEIDNDDINALKIELVLQTTDPVSTFTPAVVTPLFNSGIRFIIINNKEFYSITEAGAMIRFNPFEDLNISKELAQPPANQAEIEALYNQGIRFIRYAVSDVIKTYALEKIDSVVVAYDLKATNGANLFNFIDSNETISDYSTATLRNMYNNGIRILFQDETNGIRKFYVLLGTEVDGYTGYTEYDPVSYFDNQWVPSLQSTVEEIKNNFPYGDKTIDIASYIHTGGVKGTVGNAIQITSSTAYRYFIIENPDINTQYEITTFTGTSNNYPYYVFTTDSNDEVLTVNMLKTTTVEPQTITLSLTPNASKIYILTVASNDEGAIRQTTVKQKNVILPALSENDLTEYTEQLNNNSQFPTLQLTPELQNYAFEEAQKIIGELRECDILCTLISDTHVNGYNNTAVLTADTIAATSRITRLPCINMLLNLGDLATASETSTATDYIAELLKAMDMFAACKEKLYSIVGNHEKNAKYLNAGTLDYSQTLSAEAIYNIITKQSNVVYGNDKTYYKKDFTDIKIRFAFINVYDTTGEHPGPENTDQINFIQNVIFANDDYKIIILMHTIEMDNTIMNIIKNNSERVICILAGHLHQDRTGTITGGVRSIPYIRFASSYRNVSQTGINRITINIIGLNTKLQKLFIRRIGYNAANANTEISY